MSHEEVDLAVGEGSEQSPFVVDLYPSTPHERQKPKVAEDHVEPPLSRGPGEGVLGLRSLLAVLQRHLPSMVGATKTKGWAERQVCQGWTWPHPALAEGTLVVAPRLPDPGGVALDAGPIVRGLPHHSQG